MLYTITVIEGPICIAHQLQLPYESKCNSLHGHNYQVEVVVRSSSLNPNGMVVDFTHIKAVIKKYDHGILGACPNSVRLPDAGKIHPEVEPSTAENFARVLFEELASVVDTLNNQAWLASVSVWETPSSKVTVTGE
jgi:6-pyruvoyltetrahydropterin/6-carboxytetrahydropterin synthase